MLQLSITEKRNGVASVSAAVDPQVAGIISEEISSFLGGTCTAEECASRIQSRVTIRLAEHG